MTSALEGVAKTYCLGLAWAAVAFGDPVQATAQISIVDVSHHLVETLVPPEFDRGFFHRIGSVAVTVESVWVLDTGHRKVFRFDHAGRLVVEYGRQGNGPGEFLMVGGLRVDSVVTVMDHAGRLVVEYGPATDQESS